jgi:hypothetical protein
MGLSVVRMYNAMRSLVLSKISSALKKSPLFFNE